MKEKQYPNAPECAEITAVSLVLTVNPPWLERLKEDCASGELGLIFIFVNFA